jgi:hypothetical protein
VNGRFIVSKSLEHEWNHDFALGIILELFSVSLVFLDCPLHHLRTPNNRKQPSPCITG